MRKPDDPSRVDLRLRIKKYDEIIGYKLNSKLWNELTHKIKIYIFISLLSTDAPEILIYALQKCLWWPKLCLFIIDAPKWMSLEIQSKISATLVYIMAKNF